MNRTLITLCTYNERENIELLIPELLSTVPDICILVIDDNSPDGTGQYVDQLSESNPQIRIIHREGKLGLGTATVAGFQYGIEHQFELLINMDADFSHQPRHIPEMLSEIKKTDVVIGSRYVAGGGVVGWSLRRHLMSRTINLWARLLLGLRTRDNSGSFRCFRVPCLAMVDWSKTVSKGYAFQEEILYRLSRAGCSFSETPIRFEDRRFGTTKINMYEAMTAVIDILKMGYRRLLRQD
ncbi:MAG: polyprenol monophosphomannose synthase [Planctomycetaceae bacterium]|nr:polyprenol monophosphomannose synthase [Planctomycetaceae bacterium]